MPYEFIYHNDVLNNAARKRIRSHAALGRNKGKKISRPSRKTASTTAATSFSILAKMEGASEVAKIGFYIERPIDDGLFFPGLLPGESKGLVKKVISFMGNIQFSPELSNGLDFANIRTPMCVQHMFVDEACFHSAMATAITCLSGLVSKPEGMIQAMRHVSHTFRLVNQRLSGQSAVTDLTIAAIVSMAQYEHLQNQYQQGSVHVQGLQRIAQLRGGVGELMTSHPDLVQKMLRVDLEYSLQLGSPTLFTVEEALLVCETTTQFPSLYLLPNSEVQPLFLDQHQFKGLPKNFRDLLIDIWFLASLINNAIAGHVPKMNATEFQKNTLLLGYRLVKLNHIDSRLGICSLHNRLHLGLTACLVTFLQGWDRRIARNQLLSKMILSEAQKPFGAGQESQELLLWLLFIGAVSSCQWKNPVWVSITKHAIHGLGIKNWEDVKKILTKFPWVNVLHDKAGQALWYGCMDVHLDDTVG